MTDRYKLSQFYQGKGTETQYSSFQTVDEKIFEVENLQIVSLAMDFPQGTSQKVRQEIEKIETEIKRTPSAKLAEAQVRVFQHFLSKL